MDQTDVISNNDSNSLTNRTVSSDNLPKCDSPYSVKSSDKFYFSSNGNNNTNSILNNTNSSRPPSSPKIYSDNIYNKLTTITSSSSNYQKKHLAKNSCDQNNNEGVSTSSINSPNLSRKSPYDIEYDSEAASNQNMANYNYYSNMMTNLQTADVNVEPQQHPLQEIATRSTNKFSTLNQKYTINPISSMIKGDECRRSLYKETNHSMSLKSATNNKSALNVQPTSLKINSKNKPIFNSSNESCNSSSENDALDNISIKSINSDVNSNKKPNNTVIKARRQLNGGLTSITNGILNNSLSASASSLNKIKHNSLGGGPELRKTLTKLEIKSKKNSYESSDPDKISKGYLLELYSPVFQYIFNSLNLYRE